MYLDEEITPAVLAKETAVSTIKSNFPVRFMKAELLDEEGKSVNNIVVHDLHNTRSISLRSHISKLFLGLENGDYTFIDGMLGEVKAVIPDFLPLTTEVTGLTY